jgi:thiol-disulfide isomerase/thioredoxin
MSNYYDKYLKYKSKYISLKEQLNQTGGGNKTKVILFKANWCGHCKSFKPIWDIVTKQYDNLDFIVYDFEADSKEITNYDISGFPTIIVEKDGDTFEYKDERNADSFNNFLKQLS